MLSPWTAGFADEKKRLDVFLAEKTGISRAQAKKQIEQGGFTVNDKPVSAHYFLKEGDAVRASGVVRPAVGGTSRGSKTTSKITPTTRSVSDDTQHPTPDTLIIIKETPSYIVLYKPHGVLMHPDHDHPNGTLIDAVIAHAPETAKVGEDPTRPGIVSRLDKDVSGLVVIAKTQEAFDDLKRQFAEHSVKKEYIAIVHGEVPRDEGDLKFRIARSSTKARMAATPEHTKGGQAAWTHYEMIERLNGASLLRLQILTGRTHQIRAHLHAFGHPVIGDPLYKLKQTKRKLAAPRVMLQSVKLEFTDPDSGKRVSFEQPLDPEFAILMQQLG